MKYSSWLRDEDFYDGSVVGCAGVAIDLRREVLRKGHVGEAMPVGPVLYNYIKQSIGFDSIVVKTVSIDIPSDRGVPIYCALRRCGHQATIGVVSCLDQPTKRFGICKELMQLLCDKEGDLTPYARHQLEAELTGIPNDYSRLKSAGFAFNAALEYFLPFTSRPRELASGRSHHESLHAVAQRFRIPEDCVEHFYADQRYKQESDEYNAHIIRCYSEDAAFPSKESPLR